MKRLFKFGGGETDMKRLFRYRQILFIKLFNFYIDIS